MAAAATSMATLNKAAAEAMKAAGASACTDITGFGLFGHLMRMAWQSKLTAEVFADALPSFAGALEAFREGVIPGAVERNREFVGDRLEVAPGVDEALVHLGCDAQTSGGLLIAVPPDRLAKLVQALANRGARAFAIGRFVGPSNGRIQVTNSLAQQPHIAADIGVRAPSTMNASIPSDPHQPDCCADIFDAKPGPASSAADTQKAFGALMRSVQTAGVLSEKAKELILFSLVLHSRCHPCFDTHYQRARELGITQAELDEAAWCAIAMGGAPVRMFYQECLRRAQGATGGASK
jgi:AhpD family alkylhydroperoxidase